MGKLRARAWQLRSLRWEGDVYELQTLARASVLAGPVPNGTLESSSSRSHSVVSLHAAGMNLLYGSADVQRC